MLYQISGLLSLESSVVGLNGRVEEVVGEEVEWAGEDDAGIVASLETSDLRKIRWKMKAIVKDINKDF